MRKLIFAAIILVALLLALELAVTVLSQHGLEKVMSRQYELPSSLEVNINSFPFILSLARNHLVHIRIEWDGDLTCASEQGSNITAAYRAKLDLFDVELKMASLLAGRLELSRISRIKASMFMGEETINGLFGGPDRELFINNGRIFEVIGGKEIKYKVKIDDGRSISLQAFEGSTGDEVLIEEHEPAENRGETEVTLEGIPLGMRLKDWSLEGDKVVFGLYVPLWEGYMESLNHYLKYQPSIKS